ncbi:hypothetical protein I4U23_019830 [Adineta vaga]|nr:hypothetical protein I4U23_019830 [Adineta vaga]
MFSTKGLKNGCTTCGKMVGIFACRGCSENFCLSHTTDHREHLQNSMNEIIYNYEQLKRNLKGQTVEQYQISLIKQIDLWKQESIDKIHRLAEKIRQELEITVRHRTDDLQEKLDQLQQQFDKAQRDGGFYENDLKEWTNILNRLQQTYVDNQTLKIKEDSHSRSFIKRITLNDSFENSSIHDHQNNIDDDEDDNDDQQQHHQSQQNHISQNSDEMSGETEKSEYSFRIQEYTDASSVLFGIISKSSSDNEDPYNNPTFFGWSDKDRVYLGGYFQENYQNYHSDFQSNDICILTIDSDQDRITLENKRTNSIHELYVDRQRCALPWQIHVRLYDETD